MSWRCIVETSDCWLRHRKKERERELLPSAGPTSWQSLCLPRCVEQIFPPPSLQPPVLLGLHQPIWPNFQYSSARVTLKKSLIGKVRSGSGKNRSQKREEAKEMGEWDLHSRVIEGGEEWSRLPELHFSRTHAIAPWPSMLSLGFLSSEAWTSNLIF